MLHLGKDGFDEVLEQAGEKWIHGTHIGILLKII
jgi:hypothetical protein